LPDSSDLEILSVESIDELAFKSRQNLTEAIITLLTAYNLLQIGLKRDYVLLR